MSLTLNSTIGDLVLAIGEIIDCPGIEIEEVTD